jgi:hypothetical protein
LLYGATEQSNELSALATRQQSRVGYYNKQYLLKQSKIEQIQERIKQLDVHIKELEAELKQEDV